MIPVEGISIAIAVILGLVVGSFLNVVIHRLPKMMEREWRAQCAQFSGDVPVSEPAYNLWIPRSACPSCGRQLRAIENIPVISWLFLRGRCAGCGAAISLRYPVVELLAGLLAGLVVARFGLGIQGAAAAVFVWVLIALAFIDLDTQYLPDAITLPLLWGGLALNLRSTWVPLGSAVVGAMAGYLFLWSVYWLFKLVTRKEGMGYGDFKLLGAIGAWFGWNMLPAVVVLSAFTGALVGISLILFRGHSRHVPIPFGPYLAGGGVLALFFGEPLSAIYLHGL